MRFLESLQCFLQVFEPADEEMTVLQHQPVTASSSGLKQLKSNLGKWSKREINIECVIDSDFAVSCSVVGLFIRGNLKNSSIQGA